MRYIDVENIGLTDFEIFTCNGDYKEALKLLLTKIENAPTADVVDRARYKQLLENSTIMADALKKYEKEDVVEVVQCKDCECYDTHDHRCKFFNHGVLENDYCSRAIERRKDEQIH